MRDGETGSHVYNTQQYTVQCKIYCIQRVQNYKPTSLNNAPSRSARDCVNRCKHLATALRAAQPPPLLCPAVVPRGPAARDGAVGAGRGDGGERRAVWRDRDRDGMVLLTTYDLLLAAHYTHY